MHNLVVPRSLKREQSTMAVVTALDSIMEPKRRDIITVLSLQGLMLVLFGLFVRYDSHLTEESVYPSK